MTIDTPKSKHSQGGLLKKPYGPRPTILQWPSIRASQGMGISFKDGYNFGLGFGVAIVIVLPLIIAASLGVGLVVFFFLGLM